MALVVLRKERNFDQEVLESNEALIPGGCEPNYGWSISARVLEYLQLPQVRNPVLFSYSAARPQ